MGLGQQQRGCAGEQRGPFSHCCRLNLAFLTQRLTDLVFFSPAVGARPTLPEVVRSSVGECEAHTLWERGGERPQEPRLSLLVTHGRPRPSVLGRAGWSPPPALPASALEPRPAAGMRGSARTVTSALLAIYFCPWPCEVLF